MIPAYLPSYLSCMLLLVTIVVVFGRTSLLPITLFYFRQMKFGFQVWGLGVSLLALVALYQYLAMTPFELGSNL